MTQPGTALALLSQRVAVEPAELQQTLMATVFKGATPAEFTMLVALANKYDLDPFAKEIYAFSKQGGGIVPLVPIDGWLKIIHRHEDYDGMETIYSDEMVQPSPQAKTCYSWVETRIYHKSTPDRPTVHREYIDEMYRSTGPWNTTTKRMLEWKSTIQTGRKAFGLGGIYDEDEAERIIAGETPYDIEGSATDDTGEVILPEDYQVLWAEMQRTGLDEDAISKNLKAKAGYSGALEDMPVGIFEALMAGLKSMPTWKPKDDPDPDGGGAPVEASAEAVEQPADEATSFGWPLDPDAEAADASEEEEPRPRSAVEAGRRAAAHAEQARAAREISQKQVNLLFAQCTIHGVDEKAQLHGWLAENLGVEHIDKIPAARFDQVLAWVQGHEKGGKAA